MNKKFKESIETVILVTILLFVIISVFYVKYLLWRAEHPLAEFWTFFVPK